MRLTHYFSGGSRVGCINFVSTLLDFYSNNTPDIQNMPWGYNVFVFSLSLCLCVHVCVSVNNFRVRSIKLKPLDIFSFNFTQTLHTIRRRAEHMNRNSDFPTTWSYCPLCVNNFRVCSITLKPLDIFS